MRGIRRTLPPDRRGERSLEGHRMKDAIRQLAPLIRSWGFKGSGRNYRKRELFDVKRHAG